MMKSAVYQIPWETYLENPRAIDTVLDKYNNRLKGTTAIKIHFGEPGNENALRGHTIKPVMDWVIKKKINAYLTDTNTLYTGFRSETKNHLQTAKKHGFNKFKIPVIISDEEFPQFSLSSLKNNYKKLPIRLAKKLVKAESILCISHFKGHRMFGFGGALKNLGMGGATPAGKRILHASTSGNINEDRCTVCGTCIKNCPAKAISFKKELTIKVVIDPKKCIGCGECVTVCPQEAVEVSEKNMNACQEKTAIYAYALARNKPCVYINFLININKVCDCAAITEPLLIPNLGIMVSDNPVALDQASLDWVNKAYGKDLFLEVNNCEYQHILEVGEKIGLGNREYQINPFFR